MAMTCYLVIGSFIAANLALIATVVLNQRGMSDLRALNRIGERRRHPRS
jgi:hypothetical protein